MMKKIALMGYILIMSVSAALSMEIEDIQFTEEPGNNGTYPSPYEDEIVNISGIVTCNNYNGNKFVLSSEEGNSWNGILVYESGYYELGDEISLSGTVTEYYGLTEIVDAHNMQLVSEANPLPVFTEISSIELAGSEEYEGVLVQINDAWVSSEPDEWNVYGIDDGSGECRIAGYCFDIDEYDNYPETGRQYEYIRGIVTYSYGEYLLLPRFQADISESCQQLYFNIPDHRTDSSDIALIPVEIFYSGEELLITELALELVYNPLIMQYMGENLSGSLLENSGAEISSSQDRISINASNISIQTSSNLLGLEFLPLQENCSPLNFAELTIDGSAYEYYSNGSLCYQTLPDTLADQITLIQRPILSVPAIQKSDNSLEIICEAPANTQYWQAELNWRDISLSLESSNADYEEESGLWFLDFTVPDPEIYTLYDLVVQAAYTEPDTAKNAVYLIPEYKNEYSFIHITDTHLPGHTFWGNDLGGSDFSEVDDLRAVINDINIIKPEFVLLTGDVVNEGELEGFNGRYQYSIAKNLLAELAVPVFITAGNHDIGGWEETLPPDGTARHNWHRYFGWEYLEEAATGSYTQNYYFEYGEVLFVGLESYINYENHLPGIYGDSSFTNWQMNWLENLLDYSDATAMVLFYHYDFDEEINLNWLGADMALWGHIHSNSGSIYNQPWNLATAAVCDGNRAFRLIKVSDNELIPQPACYVQEGIKVEYELPNSGLYAENAAVITNPYDLELNDCQIIFHLSPASDYQFSGCQLEYIYDNGVCSEAAVRFDLPSNSQISISASAINSSKANEIDKIPSLMAYPNPFNPQLNISYEIFEAGNISIEIYNIKGQKVAAIFEDQLSAGKYDLSWDSQEYLLGSGIYLLSLKADNQRLTRRIVLLK